MFGATAVFALALSGVASAAVTLGSTTRPSGSFLGTCFLNADNGTENDVVLQLTDSSATPYTVPAGGETIKEWGTNTTGDTPGTPLTLVILRPAGANYTVVGADVETLPSRLFSDQDSVFPLAHPIVANAGDKLGLYSSASGSNTPPVCYFGGGSTPDPFGLDALTEPSSPVADQSLSEDADQGPSGPNFMLDVAVNQNQDASVRTTAGPSTAATGRTAVLASTVTNGGPTTAAITFTDRVPVELGDRLGGGGPGDLRDRRSDGHLHDQRACRRAVGARRCHRHPDRRRPLRQQGVGHLVGTRPECVEQHRVGDAHRERVGVRRVHRPEPQGRLLEARQDRAQGPRLQGEDHPSAQQARPQGRRHQDQARDGTHPAQTTVKVVVSSGPGRKKHKKHGARAAYLSYGAALWQR